MVCLCAGGHLGCFSFGAIMNPTAIFIAVLKLKKDSNFLTKDLLRTGCVSYSFLFPRYLACVCTQTLSKCFFGEWIDEEMPSQRQSQGRWGVQIEDLGSD